MASLFTNNHELEKPGQGEQNGVWSQTVNRNYDKLDGVLSQVTTIGLTSNKIITTSRTVVSEFDSAIFSFTGDLTAIAANRTVTMPDSKSGQWIFDFNNVTFGDRQIIVKTASETNGVTVTSATDRTLFLYSTGTSVKRVGEQVQPFIPGEIRPYIPPSGTFDRSLLPSGWYECDGTNGTPNLRNRFLYGTNNEDNYSGETKTGGASSDSVSLGTFTFSGTTGGTAITTNQMPSHSHLGYVVGPIVNNTANASNLTGSTAAAAHVAADGVASYIIKTGGGVANGGKSSSTGSGNRHTHSFSINKSLGSIVVDTIPRFYRVIYIMYTGN